MAPFYCLAAWRCLLGALGFRVWGFRAIGSEFRVLVVWAWSSGFRVLSSGFEVLGLGVQGCLRWRVEGNS